jgi:hypothetical protein
MHELTAVADRDHDWIAFRRALCLAVDDLGSGWCTPAGFHWGLDEEDCDVLTMMAEVADETGLVRLRWRDLGPPSTYCWQRLTASRSGFVTGASGAYRLDLERIFARAAERRRGVAAQDAADRILARDLASYRRDRGGRAMPAG